MRFELPAGCVQLVAAHCHAASNDPVSIRLDISSRGRRLGCPDQIDLGERADVNQLAGHQTVF